ncbi:hypothetical protein [Saccharomonospora cyanea]|uniref:Uncharacterized protein n=1 Tax=Saccharomonospora cyanea NA-134 TaxID=882082 RepID=H5XML8_9PSEU|nr:hypothetical protein [Saccharomonospora cyanea]EHR60997.1 hypothetical protein SaccyDRAFT_2105 [Saccharomonospora cyanea NA-134]
MPEHSESRTSDHARDRDTYSDLPETVLTGFADGLTGHAAPRGRSPVTAGDEYPFGTGLTY